MRKVYHNYLRWEDWKNGMWNKPSNADIEKLMPIAIKFTGDHLKYGEAMIEVVKSWKYSCQHNLTDLNQNRRAWVGHAACSYKLKLPELVVRMAWKQLSDQQRILANKQADIAIRTWHDIYYKSRQLTIW